MKKLIIGYTLFRIIKYARFITVPYLYTSWLEVDHKYCIKELAMTYIRDPISEIDYEVRGLIQFKYNRNRKTKRLKRLYHTCSFTSFTKLKDCRDLSIKHTIDMYRNKYLN